MRRLLLVIVLLLVACSGGGRQVSFDWGRFLAGATSLAASGAGASLLAEADENLEGCIAADLVLDVLPTVGQATRLSDSRLLTWDVTRCLERYDVPPVAQLQDQAYREVLAATVVSGADGLLDLTGALGVCEVDVWLQSLHALLVSAVDDILEGMAHGTGAGTAVFAPPALDVCGESAPGPLAASEE